MEADRLVVRRGDADRFAVRRIGVPELGSVGPREEDEVAEAPMLGAEVVVAEQPELREAGERFGQRGLEVEEDGVVDPRRSWPKKPTAVTSRAATRAAQSGTTSSWRRPSEASRVVTGSAPWSTPHCRATARSRSSISAMIGRSERVALRRAKA